MYRMSGSSSGSGQNVEHHRVSKRNSLLTSHKTHSRHVSITALKHKCHKGWLALNLCRR